LNFPDVRVFTRTDANVEKHHFDTNASLQYLAK